MKLIELKTENNPSEYTEWFFRIKKQGEHGRIYLFAKTKKELLTLKDNFRGHNLVFGLLGFNEKEAVKKGKKFYAISHCWLPSIYCKERANQMPQLIHGIPNPNYSGLQKGFYLLDVTEDFIKKYQEKGMCLLHDSAHNVVEKYESFFCNNCKETFLIKKVKTTEYKLTSSKGKHINTLNGHSLEESRISYKEFKKIQKGK